jgi:hypothetical protein
MVRTKSSNGGVIVDTSLEFGFKNLIENYNCL